MNSGTIQGINSNLLEIEYRGAVAQNEICFVERGDQRLMGEVIRVQGAIAYAQLFEDGAGLRRGAKVQFSGHLLEVELGPGLLSKNFDGLQNDLEAMPGSFIAVGQSSPPLSREQTYAWQASAKLGESYQAGQSLGQVQEAYLSHKIMLPFGWEGQWELTWLAPEGEYTILEDIARLRNAQGEERSVQMLQRWPVKWPLRAYREKLRPSRIFETGLRVMDSLNPLAEGGTGYVPGAFGTGKTVLQHAIAKNNKADVVLLVACGERANEVVEIFATFPELTDLATGRKLKDKTTIICNTSNMPVAAREASVYVGMTIAEYYRSMGLKVLLLADSTSRWAQALREMSNRLEELPGTDAFPVELPAVIANFYGRAGKVITRDGAEGSVTFLGTVSPAGGNFKEPVTESTSKVARCFYALAQKRADAKRYPAIDPMSSYSGYLDYEEFQKETENRMGENWTSMVRESKKLMRQGLEARDQISILGDDAVPLDYHLDFWRSELIDFAFMQQDSFDEVDMNCSLERQQYMLELVLKACQPDFDLSDFSQVGRHFKKMINLFRQMNYSAFKSEEFLAFQNQLEDLWTPQSANLSL